MQRRSGFASKTLVERFKETCRRGFSVLDRHTDRVPSEHPWVFGTAFPPSYGAQGRYRFLTTLDLALQTNPRSVLEIAAGGGLLSACMIEPGRRVVANDLRDFDPLQWRDGESMERVIGDAFKLDPKTTGTFDLVLACEVIEHVAHGVEFVQHLSSFLNPGGTLLLTTPNGAFVGSRLPTYSQITDFAALESKQFLPDADGHLYLYTPFELRDVIERAGLRDVAITLSTSPFIGGQMKVRHLPQTDWLFDAYYGIERAIVRVPQLAERLCVHLAATARKPALPAE
jgi:SAM-dependent methyltransferase